MTDPAAKTSALSTDELRKWFAQTVDDAYHGSKPPHTFDECGDPFCVDAKGYRDQVLALLITTPPTAVEPEPGLTGLAAQVSSLPILKVSGEALSETLATTSGVVGADQFFCDWDEQEWFIEQSMVLRLIELAASSGPAKEPLDVCRYKGGEHDYDWGPGGKTMTWCRLCREDRAS